MSFMSLSLALVVVVGGVMLVSGRCSATPARIRADPLPPVLPTAFVANFTEYTAPLTGPPPYVDGVPGAPFFASRGAVFYDWSSMSMIEERYDYCVNIFPEGNMYPCTFFNTHNVSYLLRNNTCCLFGQPFHPPRPDFLRTSEKAYLRDTRPWAGDAASWWEVPSIPPPTGPFWYAFNASHTPDEPQVYLSFSFPGINGWVQQNFFNVRVGPPPPHTFDVPALCRVPSLPSCNFDMDDSTM